VVFYSTVVVLVERQVEIVNVSSSSWSQTMRMSGARKYYCRRDLRLLKSANFANFEDRFKKCKLKILAELDF
jgi:hypothetical protein